MFKVNLFWMDSNQDGEAQKDELRYLEDYCNVTLDYKYLKSEESLLNIIIAMKSDGKDKIYEINLKEVSLLNQKTSKTDDYFIINKLNEESIGLTKADSSYILLIMDPAIKMEIK